jgi:hypothetical protein
MHDLKFFRKLNTEMPKQLRERGWNMIDDCKMYDIDEENKLREEMGEEKYSEYRRDRSFRRGRNSRKFKFEVEQEIKELEDKKESLMNDIAVLAADLDKFKTEGETVSEKLAEEQERLLRLADIPPQPKVPAKPPGYDKWCEEHPLDEYISHSIIKKKQMEEQEQKRRAAYSAELAEYEKALAVCNEWAGSWGLMNELKKKLLAKDCNEEQLIRVTSEYGRLSDKLRKLTKDKTDSDEKHREELARVRESSRQTINALRRELGEKDKEIAALEDMLYGSGKADRDTGREEGR